MFNLTPREKLTRARVQLNRTQPFFARLTMLMKFVEEPKILTMGVNKYGVCYYNPDFVDRLTQEELMGVLCHEVMHCALKHMTRGKQKNQHIYNISADLVINDMINENQMSLPQEGLIPTYAHEYELKMPDGGKLTIKKINERSADNIYTEIHDAWKDQQNQNQSGGGSGGEGNGNEEMEQGFDDHMYDDDKQNENNEGMEDRDGDFWDNKMVESAMASKMAGKMPKGMERLIDKITKPKMSWNQLLGKFIREKIPFDFTWRKPSKRTYSTGVYMPKVTKEGMNVALLIDTSGSMSKKDLEEVFGEIAGIIRGIHGLTLQIVWHDTKLYPGEKLNNPSLSDLYKIKPLGGGGTNFRHAYKHIKEEVSDIDVVVHLTDGYDTFPEKFDIPTIICLQRSGKTVEEVKKQAKFAQRVIKIED